MELAVNSGFHLKFLLYAFVVGVIAPDYSAIPEEVITSL
jgi:hypothetical protein